MLEVSSASVRFRSRWKSSYLRLNSSERASKSFSRFAALLLLQHERLLARSPPCARSRSSRWRLSCVLRLLELAPSPGPWRCLPASHSFSARCMSTTATRSSAARGRGERAGEHERRGPASLHDVRRSRHVIRRCLALVLERPAEREEHQALPVVGFLASSGMPSSIRSGPSGDSQRTPAPAATRVSSMRDALVGAVGVAGVDEDHALQADALHDREDDLVVEDDLLAAADRRRVDDAGRSVFLRSSRGPSVRRLEAADRVDAAREVALEERQLVAVEARVAEAVADRARRASR